MTEREILKKLVRIVDSGLGLEGDIRTILNTEARDVLGQNEELAHPAIRAYLKWCNSLEPRAYPTSDAFLAGWTQALWHIAGNFEVGSETRRHLLKASDATPEHLP